MVCFTLTMSVLPDGSTNSHCSEMEDVHSARTAQTAAAFWVTYANPNAAAKKQLAIQAAISANNNNFYSSLII